MAGADDAPLSPCATGCILSVKWKHVATEYVGFKWVQVHSEYESLSIVVPRHRDDGPGVFRAVPMIDDGEVPTGSPHFTCVAMQLDLDVEDWSVPEFSSYHELFHTIIQLGKEHAKRRQKPVRATVPIPSGYGCAHIWDGRSTGGGVCESCLIGPICRRRSCKQQRFTSAARMDRGAA